VAKWKRFGLPSRHERVRFPPSSFRGTGRRSLTSSLFVGATARIATPTLNMTDTNPTVQSISVDQLAAMPDEQRAALLQAQGTAALTPMVLALIKAKDDMSRVVLGDVMFVM
jgi:hypothetical protein